MFGANCTWRDVTFAALAAVWVFVAWFLLFLLFSFAPTHQAHAHDRDGKWAQLSAEGKAPPPEWWNALASGKGLCCSFTDGAAVKNVDWDTQDGRYRVRLHGEWIVVPENALVTEPNRFGPAVVWPYVDSDGATQIRCFLPGAGA